MHVTDECAQQFLEVFQQFVRYASGRSMGHAAVSPYPFAEDPGDDPTHDLETCFQNMLSRPSIVERFVDMNRHRLSEDQEAIALGWEDRLCGTCIMLGFADDYVVVDHDGMLFAADDISGEFMERASQMPFAAEAMLLPYAGEIVLPKPFRVMGFSKAAYSKAEIASFLEAKPPLIRGAEALRSVARVLHEPFNNWEAGESEADYCWREPEPRAFRRGALYGLDGVEREKLVNREVGHYGYELGSDWWRRKRQRPIKQAIEPTLSAALSCLTKSELLDIARAVQLKKCSVLKKADLAQKACTHLLSSRDAEALSPFVEDCLDSELDLLGELLEVGGVMGIPADDHPFTATHAPLSFTYQDGDNLIAFIPREFCNERLERCLSSERAKRRQERQARSALDACVFQYGIIPLAEAYAEYARLAEDPEDIQRFRALAMEQSGAARLVHEGETEYLMHASLTDDKVQAVVAQICKYESTCRSAYFSRIAKARDDGAMRRMTTGLMEFDRREYCARRRQEIRTWIESKNAADVSRLIEAHDQAPRKPLNAAYLEYGPVEAVRMSPEGRALQAVLDGLVPYSENEYRFADKLLEEIATCSVECGELDGAFDALRREEYDFQATYAPVLIRSAMNLYNSLPLWGERGWSARERAESIAGKPIAFAPDGVPLCAGSFYTAAEVQQFGATPPS